MREIKFRAWDKEEKKMCEVSLLRIEDRIFYGAYLLGIERRIPQCNVDFELMTGLHISYEQEKEGRFCEAKDIELMQYTGLKDKNSKEIYEGDCLGDWEDEQWVCYGIVTYDDYNGRYFLADKKGYATDYETYENSDWNQLEVINNVYENPELLR